MGITSPPHQWGHIFGRVCSLPRDESSMIFAEYAARARGSNKEYNHVILERVFSEHMSNINKPTSMDDGALEYEEAMAAKELMNHE